MRALYFLSILFSFIGLVATAQAEPGYLAYGELRGHIEPCGCDPATDLGGIKRIGAVVARERALTADLGVFDLGNNLPPAGEPGLKVPFLLEAHLLFKPTAALLNETELLRLADVAAFAAKGRNKPHYVLSNARGKVPAKDVVHGGPFVVFGYTYAPSVQEAVLPLSASLLDAWRHVRAQNKEKHAVLLFAGSDSDLQMVLAAKIFDTVISANRAPLTTVIGDSERRQEALLQRAGPDRVMMVPLGGQGLLRGGELILREAKTLASILGSEGDCAASALGKSPASCKKKSELFRELHAVTWLDKTVGESAEIESLYKRYDQATKDAFSSQMAGRLKELANSPYAGAEACTQCHASAAKAYQQSKHAHAFQTLVVKAKSEDGECVQCHVVGASAKGGFVSLPASPQLANVQCENCHGPRLAHTKNPGLTPKPARATLESCLGCHNQQHSPAFDAKSYWERIRHGL